MKVYTIDEIKIYLFNKIADVEFKDEVEEKYYKERYDICFDEFCDISKKQIAHLTEIETFVVRKSLGIFDGGVFQTDVSIGKILNLSHSRIGQIRAKALRKLGFVVSGSYELSDDDKKKIKETDSIQKIGLRYEYFVLFHRNGIETIGDLNKLKSDELGEILKNSRRHGASRFIINRMNELGYYFNNEVKDNPLLFKPIEELDFSVRTYNCLNRSGIKFLGQLVSKNVNELFEMRNMGMKSIDEIRKKLHEYGLSLSGEDNLIKKESVNNDLLSKPIEDLDFSVRTYNCLKRGNINTIGKLISKNVDELLETRNMGMKNIDEIRKKLHEYGLSLSGEDNLIKKESVNNDLLSKPIEDLDFSVRAYHCLKRGNINTIGQLVSKSVDELFQIRNMGIKVIDEIRIALHKYGLSLLGEENKNNELLESKQTTTEIIGQENFIKSESVNSELLSQSIDVLDLSVRSYNCLKRLGIDTIGKLVSIDINKLRKSGVMGLKSENEIRNRLQKHGLSFLGEDSSKLFEEKQMTTEIVEQDTVAVQKIQLLDRYRTLLLEREELFKKINGLDAEIFSLLEQINQIDKSNHQTRR